MLRSTVSKSSKFSISFGESITYTCVAMVCILFIVLFANLPSVTVPDLNRNVNRHESKYMCTSNKDRCYLVPFSSNILRPLHKEPLFWLEQEPVCRKWVELRSYISAGYIARKFCWKPSLDLPSTAALGGVNEASFPVRVMWYCFELLDVSRQWNARRTVA